MKNQRIARPKKRSGKAIDVDVELMKFVTTVGIPLGTRLNCSETDQVKRNENQTED